MRSFVIIFVLMGILSCNHKNIDNNKIIKGTVLHSEQSLKEPTDNIKEEMHPNYGISLFIFDKLPQDLKTKFIDKHKDSLSTTLLSYYDRYSEISDIDSIFEVLTSCNFFQKADEDLVSFYIHVLFEILKNDKVDGYAGESVIDVCFMLFNNYPGFFYQHINLANKHIRESLVNNIATGFYYNDITDTEIDTIFRKQKKMLPDMEKQISTIGNNIKERYMNID